MRILLLRDKDFAQSARGTSPCTASKSLQPELMLCKGETLFLAKSQWRRIITPASQDIAAEQALSFSFYFPSIGNNLISPSDITSTASAARIKPIRRVMTLIPVLPKPRAIGRASEKHSAVASAMTTP